MELRFHALTKEYGNKLALKGVNLCLTEGIYGLLGPNGAGKSTMMNILTGNLPATKGHITLDGKDIRTMGQEYRKLLGYMPQQQVFYPGFTAEQFLFYIASLRKMEKKQAASRIDALLEQVELSDVRRKPIRSFSGGMKQRLLLVQALLDDPRILVLDEPTAGLDPKQRILLRNLIGKIALNKIVLISTHVVSDVEYIAKELILLSQGEILCKGTHRELTKSLQGRVWEVCAGEDEAARVGEFGSVCGLAKTAEGISVRLLAEKEPPFPCRALSPTLEDVYLHYFGELG
jgi:ABC-type multidrug transport system ATPase subunit